MGPIGRRLVGSREVTAPRGELCLVIPLPVLVLILFVVCPPFIRTTAVVPKKSASRVYGLGQSHDELAFDIMASKDASWEYL